MNAPANRLLLCADMDRTVVPNGRHPEPAGARARLRSFCGLPGIELVYVTGRHPELVEEAMRMYALPRPHYVITDVGTRIHELGQGPWRELEEWSDGIGHYWHGRTHAQLRELLAPVAGLQLQEESKQSRHKLSFHLPLDLDRSAMLREIGDRLAGDGVEASVIWSIDEVAHVGLIDVLPLHATKLEAIEFLQRRLDCDDARTVFAGDSGNDLEVLASHVPAVLVGNASDEVRLEALRRAEQQGNAGRLFIAPSGPGNYSAGVLQGVAHFVPAYCQILEKDYEKCLQKRP